MQKILKEHLELAKLVTLATAGENGIWSYPMYFDFDNDLNIYFLIDTNSQHAKNLVYSSLVSLVIDDMKAFGTATILTRSDEALLEEVTQHLHTLHTGDMVSLRTSINLDLRLIKVSVEKVITESLPLDSSFKSVLQN